MCVCVCACVCQHHSLWTSGRERERERERMCVNKTLIILAGRKCIFRKGPDNRRLCHGFIRALPPAARPASYPASSRGSCRPPARRGGGVFYVSFTVIMPGCFLYSYYTMFAIVLLYGTQIPFLDSPWILPGFSRDSFSTFPALERSEAVDLMGGVDYWLLLLIVDSASVNSNLSLRILWRFLWGFSER